MTPVITGATETISESFRKYLNKISEKHIGHCTHNAGSTNVKIQYC
jgi:hypothetical protein